MARGSDRSVARAPSSSSRHAIHERGIEQRLVALHVDDDVVVGEPSALPASASRSVPVG
jgi:hypothetical protein